MNRPVDPDADARQQLVRRATLYSLGFVAALLIVAIGGAALVAWLLTHAGQPFVRTWLIAMAILILPGLIATLWKTLRRR